MSYWHQRDDGSRYFDWSHCLWFIALMLLYLLYELGVR